jgi:hypothetical protein
VLQVALRSIEASKPLRGRTTEGQVCTTDWVVVLANYRRAALVLFLLALPACAQSFNFNVGAGPGFPLGTTANFVHNSYDFVVGGGPNLRPHVKMNVEFMFHGIPVHQDIIQQVGVSDIKGRLYSLSGNLMLGTSAGGNKGAYLIGGGGWYRRTLEATQTVLQKGTVCVPFWEWWNVQCVPQMLPSDRARYPHLVSMWAED